MVRTITSQQAEAQIVNATGQRTVSGQNATGLLTFVWSPDVPNTTGDAVFLSTGFSLYDPVPNTDSTIIVDEPISLGPSNQTATLHAHFESAGAAGNISAGQYSTTIWDIAGTSNTNYQLAIHNPVAFTGGTDPQTYPIVQQHDIDTAVNSLEVTTQQRAVANIKSQARSNGEHLVWDPQCSSDPPTSDHQAGDQASTVTVTVRTTCTARAST